MIPTSGKAQAALASVTTVVTSALSSRDDQRATGKRVRKARAARNSSRQVSAEALIPSVLTQPPIPANAHGFSLPHGFSLGAALPMRESRGALGGVSDGRKTPAGNA